MIHVGVDLHQRFCYMTALEARGKMIQAGPVTNEKTALRKYFRQFRGKEVQVAVEACGFWPAFREVVEPEVRRLVLVHPQRVKAIASAKLKKDVYKRQRTHSSPDFIWLGTARLKLRESSAFDSQPLKGI